MFIIDGESLNLDCYQSINPISFIIMTKVISQGSQSLIIFNQHWLKLVIIITNCNYKHDNDKSRWTDLLTI